MKSPFGPFLLSLRLASTTAMSQKAVWDPVNQIYVDGVVPENARVQELIDANHGALRIFGYGSLCWNPGSMTTAKSQLGRVYGYRRCWAQKSTDHRGTPRFPGIVCTLLKDEEFRGFRTTESESITEGMLYEIPPEDVDDLLAELDFREKGVRRSKVPERRQTREDS